MTNFSYDEVVDPACAPPVTSFTYREIGTPSSNGEEIGPVQRAVGQQEEIQGDPGPSAEEISDAIQRARAEATAETERRLRGEYEARSAGEAAKIAKALELFLDERKSYFSRIESEVVQLSLAIAAKILHRESQVDPMLVAALVRVAVDKLHDGSSVSVRISPANAGKWHEYLANPLNGSTIAIIEDAHLTPDDCILETDLGSANFSVDAQLKEVEQGFFDLLAQRPTLK